MKKEIPTPGKKKGETIEGLKNETHEKEAIKKGYNEQNPSQPQGAFRPDTAGKKN